MTNVVGAKAKTMNGAGYPNTAELGNDLGDGATVAPEHNSHLPSDLISVLHLTDLHTAVPKEDH